MKALSIDSPGVARLVERARPIAGPGEVLLQVAFAGLCGTDLSAFLGKNPLIEYPRIIGHEIAAKAAPDGYAFRDRTFLADHQGVGSGNRTVTLHCLIGFLGRTA